MNIYNKYCLLLVGCFYLTACSNNPKGNHGPIKLGDSSTIVTETDPQKLEDLVADLKPDIPVNADTPKAAAPAVTADTVKKTAAVQPPQAPMPAGPGLKAEFKEVTVMVPGMEVKQSGKTNLQNANGAVYTWISGNINGNALHVKGNVTKVSQRYQSIVVLKGHNNQSLPLDELSNTTAWKQVNGGNGTYAIKGVGDNELDHEDASANEIRNAVTKAARARRLNHKKAEEWLNLLGKNTKSVTQKPLVVTLRSVMWKIDGKDEKGKIFSKQIRVDVPM